VTVPDVGVVTDSASPAPGWLADVDNDEWLQLEALGVDLVAPENNDFDALDMLASELLRHRSGVERALSTLKATQQRERDMLAYRQDKLRAPLEARAKQLDEDTARLAVIAATKGAFDKKAQSRKTSFGTYGRKRTSAKTVVSDSTLATAWAIENLPDAVSVETRLSLKAAKALSDEGVIAWTEKDCSVPALALVAAFDGGAKVPGVERKLESVKYYGEATTLEPEEL
jgi:hypothetical protein